MDSVMHPIQSSFKYNKVVENANLQEYHVSGMEAIKKNGKMTRSSFSPIIRLGVSKVCPTMKKVVCFI